MNVRMVNYFDNYTWQTDALFNFDVTKAFGTQWTDSYLGMATGSLVRNVEDLNFYRNVDYFDFKGRVIQNFSQNHVGGIDRLNVKYSFMGEILKALKTTDKGTATSKITDQMEYTYDHLGRRISYVLNGKPIGKYEYDAIGRLKGKKFSPSGITQNSKQTGNWTDVNTWLSGLLPNDNDNVTINAGHTLTIPSGQIAGAGILNDKGILRNFGTLNMGKYSTVDLYNLTMSYHIRGGLRGINLDNSGNLTNALFSMKLFYEDDQIYFDGNIRKQEWKTGLDNVTRTFTYRYDGSSRIKAGSYVGKVGENYTLSDVIYDDNGNIKKLIRNGLISGNTFGIIDNLNYTYNTNSNKILKVDDVSTETASFKDVAGNDYTYWADGSLRSDANKGITEIQYNYLKKQSKITFANGKIISYQYDASGKKLKETSGSVITDYVGNTIYKNNTLYQITHDEGRIVDGIYEYNITDHLENLRVAFKDSLGIAKIVQSNAYGVWGEDLPTLKYLNTPKINNFGYLKREFQVETGYTDLVNRQFDNIIGRFTSLDPIIEGQEHLSLYQYGWNNPLRYTDPDERMAQDILVVGTEEYRQQVMGDLQKLTNQKLVFKTGSDGQGRVAFAGTPDGGAKPVGTDLVSSLISSPQNVIIQQSSDGDNHTNFTNQDGAEGKIAGGSGSVIQYNPKNTGSDIVNQDGTTGRPAQVGLAHELGHAKDGVKGNVVGSDLNNPKQLASGLKDGSVSIVKNPDIGGERRYMKQDEINVRRYIDNPIRKEQGVRPRALPVKTN